MAKEYVKDFYGKVLGYTEEINGKLYARDFYGKVLGYYEKSTDTTRDFYGRVLTKGNTVMGLLYK